MDMKAHQRDERDVTEKPASKRKRIFTLLQRTANVLGKELQPDEFELWQRVLLPYPLQTLEIAFEDVSRTCKYFPKPSDVLELLDAYHLSAVHAADWKPCGHCTEGWQRRYRGRTSTTYYDSAKKAFVRNPTGGNPIDPHMGALLRCSCFRNDVMMSPPFYENYGQGYGANDVKALMKLHEQRRKLNSRQPLSQAAQTALLDELDARRDRA